MVITENITIFVVVKGNNRYKKDLKKKVIKYLVSSKKIVIFVLKVGETNKVKKEILNIKNYDRQN